MRKPKRLWTPEDDALLITMHEVDGLRWAEIDAYFKRAGGSSYTRYSTITSRSSRPAKPKPVTDPVAERDRRRGLVHETITAQFFGDPLPGRSALDEKRAACAN